MPGNWNHAIARREHGVIVCQSHARRSETPKTQPSRCNSCQLPTLNCSFCYSWLSVHCIRCLGCQLHLWVTWRRCAGDPPTSVGTGAVARADPGTPLQVGDPLSDTAISASYRCQHIPTSCPDPSHRRLFIKETHPESIVTAITVVDNL